MFKMARFVSLLLCCAVLFGGCRSVRTTPVSERVVNPPEPAPPAPDVPPVKQPGSTTTVTSVNNTTVSSVPGEDKPSLIYQAQLDLLRILVCTEEAKEIGGQTTRTDVMQQAVAEHLSNLGFRILDGPRCPGYLTPTRELAALANERDIDLFVLLRGTSKQVDKFGSFYSFEVDGRGKVVQITGEELLTTQSELVRGKRALNREQAAESALRVFGEKLGTMLSDEIVRKSGRGVLVRRVRVDGLPRLEDADNIRVDLGRKPGIRSVALSGWDERTRVAVFWVYLDASAKENLGAYLEELGQIRLRVERLDQTGAATEKKGRLEF
ncbi:MAG: hypothetical protein JW955_04415 [Sedimentisphaerales bacterium]|nr:hypothetical protein [Sedimentisphaerales bacterium]